MIKLSKPLLALAAGAAVLTGIATPAMAQRSPEYAAARANGSVGEQLDGYLGVVGNSTVKLQQIVDEINIQRRAVYTRKAQQNSATVEQYATTAGCQAILRTTVGEKYQAPDGTWKTRSAAPPERLPICP